MPRQVDPGPIPPGALRFLAEKGLQPTQRWTDVWRTEHAHAFSVAGILEYDLLAEVLGSLTQTLADGVPFEQWKRDVPLRLPEHRMRLIYETNLRQARAAALWERIDRNKRALPYLQYTLGPSRDHRDQHVGLAGIILPVDHPFWDTHTPMNGFGCKCGLIQLTASAARRRGYDPDNEFNPDTLPTVTWKDPRNAGRTLTPPLRRGAWI